MTAVDFSDDGGTLLTAVAKMAGILLWDLVRRKWAAQGRAREIKEPSVDAITAAKLAPGQARRIVAAGLTKQDTGKVFYWDDKPGPDGKPGRFVEIGETPGRVLSVAFLPGGRFVAAAGQDGRLSVWELAEDNRTPGKSKIVVNRVAVGPDHGQHTESINELMAWPRLDGPALVSGSDDSTIRFWAIEPDPRSRNSTMQLLGTISSAPDETPIPAGRIAGAGVRADVPWVAFTPEGVYDSSLAGESLVTFSDGRGVQPLDQYAPRLFHPLLTDDIRQGKRPSPNFFSPPPPLVIQAPEDRGPTQAEVEVVVSLGDSEP